MWPINPRAKARGFFIVADAARVVRRIEKQCLMDDGNASGLRLSLISYGREATLLPTKCPSTLGLAATWKLQVPDFYEQAPLGLPVRSRAWRVIQTGRIELMYPRPTNPPGGMEMFLIPRGRRQRRPSLILLNGINSEVVG